MSQLDLALACGVSARHLSFLETGRANPSRDMVMQLAESLLLPLGERNALLQSAGFAPAFPASPLSSEALAPFRRILTAMVERHAPWPAMLCDRHWTIRDANMSAAALLAPLQGAEGEMNIVRMFTKSPLAKEIVVNYAEVVREMRGRIALETLEAATDPVLAGLLDMLDAALADSTAPVRHTRQPVVPLIVRSRSQELRFLSTVAHFGTTEDVTVRDLRLELLFPADDITRDAFRAPGSGLATAPLLGQTP